MQLQHARPAAVDTRAAVISDSFANEGLINQAALKRLAGDISDMTVWRWRRAGLLPEPTNIRGRNYWRARDVRAVLDRLMSGGIAA